MSGDLLFFRPVILLYLSRLGIHGCQFGWIIGVSQGHIVSSVLGDCPGVRTRLFREQRKLMECLCVDVETCGFVTKERLFSEPSSIGFFIDLDAMGSRDRSRNGELNNGRAQGLIGKIDMLHLAQILWVRVRTEIR